MNKSLIIYFSRKGRNYVSGEIKDLQIGNTEIVANMIQEITDGDKFEIETVKEYPIDYHETTDIAKEELRNNQRPELKRYLESIENYNVIYLGYPNWWGTMPMPVFTFLEKYNFSNKAIMPFCTHEGSGLGRSENDIKSIIGNDIVKKRISYKRIISR